MQLGPGGMSPVTAADRELTKFMSRDRRTSVTYTSNSIVVETTNYPGWTEFKGIVAAAIDARQDIAPMDGLVRLGIRIIDEVRVPHTDPPRWSDWLSPALLAPAVEVGDKSLDLLQQQSVVQYAGLHAGETITVRYGAVEGPPAVGSAPNLVRPNLPGTGHFFLIDTDSAWELPVGDETPALVTQDVLALAQGLHDPMKVLFEEFITDRLRNEVFSRG